MPASVGHRACVVHVRADGAAVFVSGGGQDLIWVHAGSLDRRIVGAVMRAAGAVLVGLLILTGGLVLRSSAQAAIHTVAEVLSVGGAVVAVIGLSQLVMRFVASRDE